MTELELWEALIALKPKFATEGVSLTAKGLRKLVKEVYKHGHEEGVQEGMRLVENPSKSEFNPFYKTDARGGGAPGSIIWLWEKFGGNSK